jgi:hypothetical protein
MTFFNIYKNGTGGITLTASIDDARCLVKHIETEIQTLKDWYGAQPLTGDERIEISVQGHYTKDRRTHHENNINNKTTHHQRGRP